MLVFNMTVHNMHATVLACTRSNSLYSVLGLGYPHIGTKVIYFTEHESSGAACGGAKLDSHCEPKVKLDRNREKSPAPKNTCPVGHYSS